MYKWNMQLQLLIRSGSASGQVFNVKAGVIIGRASSADISFSDSKLSGRHAKIELDKEGHFLLTDLGSTNGLRLENRRVNQVRLTPGLVFRAGNTVLEVIVAREQPTPEVPAANLPPEPPPPAPKRKDSSWDEYLADFAKRAQAKVQNRSAPLAPFDPLLVLTVVRGLQVGTQWVLGYGPREVGHDTLEFHIMDSPSLAFRVSPRGDLAFYETPHPKQVRLNGSSTSTEMLHAGDEIQISNTIIKVSYKE